MLEAPPNEITAALHRLNLLPPDASARGERLTGGVSSDIWRIDTPTGPICIKRALAKLRVAADWRAPIERNVYEARWMRHANAAVPGSAPAILGQDAESGALAMAFLPPDDHPLWKAQLRDGHADPGFATAVASTLARIHAATAADPTVPAQFPTDAIFYDIRLEPYLVATGRAHPDLTDRFDTLVATTQANKRALVHGDVSPKNILVGPQGPVLLDAECACWGDPAFDIAFCLNHLLLKCLWNPEATLSYLAAFDALAQTYLQAVDWEPPEALQGRATALLPGLLLARVDGKSPVEYITRDDQRDMVRRFAAPLLRQRADSLQAIATAWREELER